MHWLSAGDGSLMEAEIVMVPYHVSKREAHHGAFGDHRRQRLGYVVRVEVTFGPPVRQDSLIIYISDGTKNRIRIRNVKQRPNSVQSASPDRQRH